MSAFGCTDIKNESNEYYNIVTKCNLKNVPTVIKKIMSILKNYKITDEEIAYAKNTRKPTCGNKS